MKFKKLGNLENFSDKSISIQGEMPITLANAFEVSKKRVDKLNKDFAEQEKNADEFVKETENKRNYKKITSFSSIQLTKSLEYCYNI